ncbi:MAG: hypothetical protein ABIK90_02395 [candidate division WOR-3 bacterium]
MLILLLIFNQFEFYYQHNFGKRAYVSIYYDFNQDNHKDAQVSYYSSNYYDSIVLYALPTTERLAKYVASPYQTVNLLAYLENRRFLIWRYSYNQTTGRYTGRVYYYENYENLVWSSTEITSNSYIFCNALDVNNDNRIDIVITYTNPDTTTLLLIYRGSILDIKEKENKPFLFKNQILITLTEAGDYEIDFYDPLGRKIGTYFLKGKKGENIITPPFLVPGLSFYLVKKENRVILKGKITNEN